MPAAKALGNASMRPRHPALSGTPIHPVNGCEQEEVMQVLATAIGVLLILASYPALAQELGHESDGVQPRPARQAGERLARLTTRQSPDEQPVETDEPRQPEAMKAETARDQPAPATETEMPRDPEWTALAEKGLGTTMDFPRAVFSMADDDVREGAGRKYRTPDRRGKVAVWTQHNTKHDTPAGYLRRTFAIPRASVDYERFTPDFAVVSGDYGGRVYYIRCNLSPRGNLHCFDLAYPVQEKKAWDRIVTRMSRSLRPGGD
jgi:hypothetical protein